MGPSTPPTKPPQEAGITPAHLPLIGEMVTAEMDLITQLLALAQQFETALGTPTCGTAPTLQP
jgi:hypothetical protein